MYEFVARPTFRAVVLSHRAGTRPTAPRNEFRTFDGAPSTVGATILLEGRPFTVVGVLRRDSRR